MFVGICLTQLHIPDVVSSSVTCPTAATARPAAALDSVCVSAVRVVLACRRESRYDRPCEHWPADVTAAALPI